MALKLGCKPIHLISKITFQPWDFSSVQKCTPLIIDTNIQFHSNSVHNWHSPCNISNVELFNLWNKTQGILMGKNFSYFRFGIASGRRKISYDDLPQPPKKPLSPPLVYVNTRKKEAKETGKIILSASQYLEIWSKLSEKEKAKYQQAYQEQHAVYKEKYLEYKNSLTEEEKLKFKKIILEKKKEQLRKESVKLSRSIDNIYAKEAEMLGKPKYPGSSIYIYWQSLLNDQPEKKLAMPQVIESWNLLPENEKEKYKNMFQERFATYKSLLETWEQRMNEEGKLHLIRKGAVDKFDKMKVDGSYH